MKYYVLLSGLACGILISGPSFGQMRGGDPDEARGSVPILEKYGDPPWISNLTITGPAGGCKIGSFTSVQVNVNAQGQNILNDAANEPSICINPNNHNLMTIAWRQFNNKTSNFRQAGWAYTTNGGLSWTFPGVLENNVFRSDPVLQTDADGNFFYLSLLQTFYDDVWKSINGGANFSRVADATGGDKEWFTIDRTNSIGKGNMYQYWSTAGNNYGGRQFSRSVNGGITWSSPINIPNDMVWGVLDVGPNGELYLGGSDSGNQFYFARSSNAKDKSQSPTFDMSRTINLGGSMIYGSQVNPDGLAGQVWLACDRSGGATNGYLYMLCSVYRNSSNPCDVMFARSTDGGNTWSTGKRINDDSQNGGKYHWFGTLSVAPNGRVDVIWYDTRNSGNNSLSELWYTYSTDGGATFAPNIKVSAQFNQSLGYPNQNKIGDYMGMISDNTGADVAYAATFNGEEDVYYVRIEAIPETDVPDSGTILQGTQVSGSFSDLAANDSTYWVTQALYTPILIGDPLKIQISSHTQKHTPGTLQFKFDGKVNAAGLTQKISLYNFQTNSFELVDSRAATTSDSTVTVNATGDLSRFVNQSTGEVRALISYSGFNPANLLFRASMDMANWIIGN